MLRTVTSALGDLDTFYFHYILALLPFTVNKGMDGGYVQDLTQPS